MGVCVCLRWDGTHTQTMVMMYVLYFTGINSLRRQDHHRKMYYYSIIERIYHIIFINTMCTCCSMLLEIPHIYG